MTNLSVNLNAVAFLRNRRHVPWPSVTGIARAVLIAGAHGITIHPRPDQRHIRFADVDDLALMLRADFPQAEFNIEGYPTDDFMLLVAKAAPDQVTLVPDFPDQSTSDHGWDFIKDSRLLEARIQTLKTQGFRVSLFIDPDSRAPLSAWRLGADRVELYTGPYGGALKHGKSALELGKLIRTSAAARTAGHSEGGGQPGVKINAGHDLTLANLPNLVKAIPDIAEVSIGHGIAADALMMGFPEATRRYLEVLGGATFN